jgi:Chitin binding Peritrophin-A domain
MRNGAIIANPNNCRAYIECQQNLRLDRECSRGEFFDARSGVCMTDFAVDCGNRAIQPRMDNNMEIALVRTQS